jgi:uncharacterized SAM-binding protein YcdF (DUF218 family)
MVDSEHRHMPLEAADRGAPHTGAPGRRRRPLLRLLFVALLGLAVAAGIAFAIGFFHFVLTIADLERPVEARSADAIVALTGGADRIADAVALLREGRAHRLLISGVYPDTSRETLASMTPGGEPLFACCIDLGRSALNTVGNAKEARDWARGNGFTTLFVVTASYHLPRSLNEIRREMPEAELIPYPVVSANLRLEGWWRNPGTSRLLLAEYSKYLMSVARIRLGGPATSIEARAARLGS